MLAMIVFPDVQKKAQAELDEVVDLLAEVGAMGRHTDLDALAHEARDDLGNQADEARVQVRLGLFEEEVGERARVAKDEDERGQLGDERGGELHRERGLAFGVLVEDFVEPDA